MLKPEKIMSQKLRPPKLLKNMRQIYIGKKQYIIGHRKGQILKMYCVKIYPDFYVCTFLSDELLFKKMGLTVMNLNSKNKEY